MPKKRKKPEPQDKTEGDSSKADRGPDLPPTEDDPARRLREFLQGRFPDEELPPGIPPLKEEPALPRGETDPETGNDEEKEAPRRKKRKPKNP